MAELLSRPWFLPVAAFVLGYAVAKIGSYFGDTVGTKRRDPRDQTIRSLQAELKLANERVEQLSEERSNLDQDRDALNERTGELKSLLTEREQSLEKLRDDLKDSIARTNELRRELTERAAESIREQVRLKEVETELSVLQETADLIDEDLLGEKSHG